MSEIFKTIKGFEQTLKTNQQENELKIRELNNEMITFEKKLKIWKDV